MMTDACLHELMLMILSLVKASGKRTPQPTPAALSAPVETIVGTPARLSFLRRDCLIRDRHRCVVSNAFDEAEAISRDEKYTLNPKDDDGQPLDPENTALLEVAHIIPHSLMSTVSSGNTSELVRETTCNSIVLSSDLSSCLFFRLERC